uniref:Protein kinase domain-containing protein n=1 Tax=Acanthochromis polyacanthus TaxID=80966 RepID=A0A3Q1GNR9_9TELE
KFIKLKLRLCKNRNRHENTDLHEYLGKGGYGVVAKCFNVETEEIVAIKVYHEYVQKEEVERELECLKKLQQVDPDEHNLVKFIDHLKYKGQLCLVFEMLGSHLVDFMISREWKPLNVAEIRPIAQQLLVALEALKSIGLVHADIKPDNIVFVNLLQSLKVKLIDFGCAAEASKLEEFDSIQVPGFRAPEAILGLPLTEAVDMWAVGAVLALLFLECHEPFGQAWRMKTPYEYQQERRNQVTRCSSYFEEFKDTKAFLSLLKQMLDIDPNKRITPSTALGHRFITSKVRSSNEASTSDNDTEGSTKAALDQGGTKDQITAVTVSDGITNDERITAASLNIRTDRPPQEVTVKDIEPAENIMEEDQKMCWLYLWGPNVPTTLGKPKTMSLVGTSFRSPQV